MDATLLPQKHLPATEACTTYTLPDAGVLNGQHLWGVANQPMPNSHSCYILDDEPWDYWSVPVHPGEQITFALESNVRAYFSIETGSVFSGSSTLQPNGKWLTGYIWTVPSTFSGATARLAVSPYATTATYTLAVGKPEGSAGCTASAANLASTAAASRSRRRT